MYSTNTSWQRYSSISLTRKSYDIGRRRASNLFYSPSDFHRDVRCCSCCNRRCLEGIFTSERRKFFRSFNQLYICRPIMHVDVDTPLFSLINVQINMCVCVLPLPSANESAVWCWCALDSHLFVSGEKEKKIHACVCVSLSLCVMIVNICFSHNTNNSKF